jgi:hypothetical protein
MASGSGRGNKGSEHMSLAVHRLIGPRVVCCSDVVLDEDGTTTVYFPELPVHDGLDVTDIYAPFVSSECGVSTCPACWLSFTSTSFDVTGCPGATVSWQIVKKGLWGAVTNDAPASMTAKT